MKKFFYDLHIHTALSPCSDDDMTPQNIINMASLCGLDVIAITDHNSCQNVGAVIKASRALNGALVIAGMELTTSEEIHVLLYFYDLNSAIEFEAYVQKNKPLIKNKKQIFGSQLVLDSNDNIVKEEEILLIPATNISIENIDELARKFNAVAVPAHIDKPSNAIIAILGAINPSLGFHTVEVSPLCSNEEIKKFRADGYAVLQDSDSHFLGTFNENKNNFLLLEELSVEAVLNCIKSGKL